MIKYGQDITYTDFWGRETICGCNGHDTLEEAQKEAIEMAKLDGWTPPKWWEWWRRKDTRIKI